MTMTFSRRGSGVLLALAALLGAGALAGVAAAQTLKSENVIGVKAKADKPGPDGKQVISVTITPKKGWHVYANPVGLEDFAENQTVVTVVGKEAKIDYPAGKPKKDTVGTYKIYDEPTTIKAVVQRGTDTKPLEVTVKIQACDAKRCLLPSTVKVPVE